MPIRALIWNEFRHEKENPEVSKLYPLGIHGYLADSFASDTGLEVSTATLDHDADHGLAEERLAHTDVLLWWGHKAHDEVRDEVVTRVQKHVLQGMGFIALHSAHYSKIFKALMGTSCSLKWRARGEKERLWNVAPNHPITQGIDEYLEVPKAEMYGERFDIPEPDQLIFLSWFEGGEVFRSGCTWSRGHGRIFYFRPGHETFPVYHDANIQTILKNAIHWATPYNRYPDTCPNPDPLEPLSQDS
ncbi:MAG: ThuA domain-containing protein [Verrucomicrobiota bacterium]